MTRTVTYFFRQFRLECDERALIKGNESQRLTPTLFGLLTVLLEGDGRVLTKEKILEKVWRGRFVGDGSLNRQISTLRKLLGDTRAGEHYIETLSGLGYRFTAPIRKSTDASREPRRESPFPIGRIREYRALDILGRSAAGGRGNLVWITGDPGAGKTTLAECFLESAGSNFYVAKSQAYERFGESNAYRPLIDAISDLLRRHPPHAEVIRKYAPGWMSRSHHQSDSPSAGAAAKQQQMKQEFLALLQALTQERPLILFIDDWQWVDPSTLELLSYVSSKFSELPLLWICAYRNGESSPDAAIMRVKAELRTRRLFSEIPLDGLSIGDIQEYLNCEFPGHRFTPDLAEFILEKTQGNPLFVVELMRYMRRHGILRREEGVWKRIRRAIEIEPSPDSIQSLIRRKVHQLSDTDRLLLTIASVQGFEFDSDLLAAVSGLNSSLIELRLTEIQESHALIRILGESDWPGTNRSIRCAFSHVLYQNALYASLAPARRKALASDVAAALANIFGDQYGRIAPQLAFLTEESGDLDNASYYLACAAESVARVGSYLEAITLTRRALSLLRRARLECVRTDLESPLLEALARYDWNVRSSEHLQEAIECCDELIRRRFRLESSYALLGSTHALLATYMTVPPREAIDSARRASAAALAINENNAEAEMVMGFIELIYDWRFEAANGRFGRAIGLDPHSATAHQWHSCYFVVMNDFESAIKSISVARSLDPTSPIICSHYAWVLYFARRFEAATAHLRRSIEMDPGFWRAYLNLGWCLLAQSRCEEAVEALEKAVTLNENNTVLAFLAQCYARCGMRSRTMSILERVFRSGEYASPYSIALAFIALQDFEKAFQYLESSLVQRDWFLIFANVEPALDPIRSLPRFAQLLNRIRPLDSTPASAELLSALR